VALLLNVVALPCVNTDFVAITKFSLIYRDLLTDLHLQRLAPPLLPSISVDLQFWVLHDLLPNRERQHRFQLAPPSACL
jgi:hypothetical protein